MSIVWVAARATLRRRWPATIALALVIAMAGGVVLVAIAGLRRTEGALPRFLDHNRAGDASVVFNEDLPLADQEALAAKVSELPMVTDAGAGALVVHRG